MKRTSYFRTLLNAAEPGTATLRPAHKPTWGLVPASIPEVKSLLDGVAPARLDRRPPVPAPPADLPPDAAGRGMQFASPAAPRVPPSAPDRRSAHHSDAQHSELPAEKRPEPRVERRRMARPAANPLHVAPGKIVAHAVETAQTAQPAPAEPDHFEAPHRGSPPIAQSHSTRESFAGRAMGAFIEAARASEFSLPAVHSVMATGATQDRQARNAPRASGLSNPEASSAAPRLPEPPSAPPAETNSLAPAPQAHQPAAALPPQPRRGNTVHIGTVDIHIAPPSVPRTTAPARVPAASVPSLARGFQTSIGLRQG